MTMSLQGRPRQFNSRSHDRARALALYVPSAMYGTQGASRGFEKVLTTCTMITILVGRHHKPPTSRLHEPLDDTGLYSCKRTREAARMKPMSIPTALNTRCHSPDQCYLWKVEGLIKDSRRQLCQNKPLQRTRWPKLTPSKISDVKFAVRRIRTAS